MLRGALRVGNVVDGKGAGGEAEPKNVPEGTDVLGK